MAPPFLVFPTEIKKRCLYSAFLHRSSIYQAAAIGRTPSVWQIA